MHQKVISFLKDTLLAVEIIYLIVCVFFLNLRI